MNIIEAKLDKSDYEIYDDFLNIKIDGEWLDEKLGQLYPDEMYRGTIPTLLFAMEVDAESKIVWNRIFPDLNAKTVCPILMCPDDNDFSCTLIIAEIENNGKCITWNRLGVDITKDWDPEKIGSEVRWFDGILPLQFTIDTYSSMIQAFKDQFLYNEANYVKRNKEWLENNKGN